MLSALTFVTPHYTELHSFPFARPWRKFYHAGNGVGQHIQYRWFSAGDSRGSYIIAVTILADFAPILIIKGFYAGTAEISVTPVSAQQPVHPGP